MKSIFIFMMVCLLLAVAVMVGEALFGTSVDAGAIREVIRGKI